MTNWKRFTVDSSNDKDIQNSGAKISSGAIEANELKNHIDKLNTKIDSLAENLNTVCNSVASFVTDDDNFETVQNRRNRKTRLSQNFANRGVSKINAAVANSSTTPSSQKDSNFATNDNSHANTVNQIPVIFNQFPNNTNSVQSLYSNVVAGRCNKTDRVFVIGTSIPRGSGKVLNEKGINATSFSYGGTKISHIRQRIPHLTKENDIPQTVALQAGGNDCETAPLEN